MHRCLRVACALAGALFLGLFAMSAGACGVNTVVKDATLDDIERFFKGQRKTVVTFVGYSGRGYEDHAAMLAAAGRALDALDPSHAVVNVGATPEGIGAVYELAKSRGFMTTGIVSTQANVNRVELSSCVDHVFYVQDATWGGLLAGGDQLSPTSQAMVAASDVLIAIGGGEVARDELMAAQRLGKQVRFIAADMNHDKARHKAREKGVPVPADFSGAAAKAFLGPKPGAVGADGMSDPQALVGGPWQWHQTLYNNDQKHIPAHPAHYTIAFHPDGTLGVRADCNQGGGTYSIEGQKLAIEVTHTTLAMCPPGSLDQAFLQDLAAAAVYFFSDGYLHLDLKYDTGTMKFGR